MCKYEKFGGLDALLVEVKNLESEEDLIKVLDSTIKKLATIKTAYRATHVVYSRLYSISEVLGDYLGIDAAVALSTYNILEEAKKLLYVYKTTALNIDKLGMMNAVLKTTRDTVDLAAEEKRLESIQAVQKLFDRLYSSISGLIYKLDLLKELSVGNVNVDKINDLQLIRSRFIELCKSHSRLTECVNSIAYMPELDLAEKTERLSATISINQTYRRGLSVVKGLESVFGLTLKDCEDAEKELANLWKEVGICPLCGGTRCEH